MNNAEYKLLISQPTKLHKMAEHRDYEEGDIIGHGTFGRVNKAVHRYTKRNVAIKTIGKRGVNYDDIEDEIKNLIRPSAHDNIVKYETSYRKENRICIVMEYCTLGYIGQYLPEKNLNRQRRMRFIQDIASGIAYLHELGIMHMDLKPANILVTRGKRGRHTAKLADFGLANTISEQLDNTDIVWTVAYMSPQVIEDKQHYCDQDDIFSMGLVFCGILDDDLKIEIEAEPVGSQMLTEGYNYIVPEKLGNMKELVAQMIEKKCGSRLSAIRVKEKVVEVIALN